MTLEHRDAHQYDGRQDHEPGTVRGMAYVGDARDKAGKGIRAQRNLLEYADTRATDQDAADCHNPALHLSVHSLPLFHR